MKVRQSQAGQANLTTILVVIGLIVAGVWVWKNLDYDTQDIIVEDVLPMAFLVLLAGVGVWLLVRKIKQHRNWKLRRQRLISKFQAEASPDKRLDLAFSLIEVNGYKLEGLETVASDMAALFRKTLKTALGDKQHRIRGMAASQLGVVRDQTAIPLLIKALEDDHAYVRGCAALALGRMRVGEAKDKLAYVMKEDWDQTVRSRAREAWERIA